MWPTSPSSSISPRKAPTFTPPLHPVVRRAGRRHAPPKCAAAPRDQLRIIYGTSPSVLPTSFHPALEEASAHIKKYFERFPRIRDYIEETKAYARENGHVETVFGRRIHYPEIRSPNSLGGARASLQRARSINACLQGNGGRHHPPRHGAHRAGTGRREVMACMLLQVQYELIFEVYDDEVEATIPVICEVSGKRADAGTRPGSVPARRMRAPPTTGTKRTERESFRPEAALGPCCSGGRQRHRRHSHVDDGAVAAVLAAAFLPGYMDVPADSRRHSSWAQPFVDDRKAALVFSGFKSSRLMATPGKSLMWLKAEFTQASPHGPGRWCCGSCRTINVRRWRKSH